MSFVTKKVCLSWQNICHDKHNFVFVVTKIIIVAAPANDNWTVLLCIITGFSFCLSSAVSPGLWTVSLHAHHDGSFPPVAFSSSDTWAFFFLFSVPSSVPTSKALLLCRLSQYQYHQPHPGLILHHGPAPRHPHHGPAPRHSHHGPAPRHPHHGPAPRHPHHGPAPRHPQEEMSNWGGLPSKRDIALLLSHFDGGQ